mmetsp:Transcript_53149/g.94850  ORF Transcript_53149/g.94850 Transcript_53149/m.94850 type:complete len:208 (+) Transcript_53149:1320-1943(+)
MSWHGPCSRSSSKSQSIRSCPLMQGWPCRMWLTSSNPLQALTCSSWALHLRTSGSYAGTCRCTPVPQPQWQMWRSTCSSSGRWGCWRARCHWSHRTLPTASSLPSPTLTTAHHRRLTVHSNARPSALRPLWSPVTWHTCCWTGPCLPWGGNGLCHTKQSWPIGIPAWWTDAAGVGCTWWGLKRDWCTVCWGSCRPAGHCLSWSTNHL